MLTGGSGGGWKARPVNWYMSVGGDQVASSLLNGDGQRSASLFTVAVPVLQGSFLSTLPEKYQPGY